MSIKQINHILSHAEEKCRKQGSQFTSKRRNILFSLLKSKKAMSAYELVDFCKTEFDVSIPAMSVYRILDFLQQQHLVHKLNSANKFVACTHIACDHDHAISQFLICSECQAVEEISISKSTINTLQKNIEKAGFHLVTPQLEMDCICHSCAPQH